MEQVQQQGGKSTSAEDPSCQRATTPEPEIAKPYVPIPLPPGYIEQTLGNKPQNFNAGKKRAALPPNRTLCTNSCGAVLPVGFLQANHNTQCPKHLKYEQEIRQIKASNILNGCEEDTQVFYDEAFVENVGKATKTPVSFQYGHGFYKPSKNFNRSASLLLPSGTVVEQRRNH